MSLYHVYLGDTTVTTDRLEGAYERSGLFRASRPPTPRFEDIAEPLALDGISETLSGISAPTTPLPLRILVAVVFIYRNNTLVLDLVT
ncbi:hypothetical protein ANO14919_019800 [Xylariales sp. No.14919]|nr:hypothetical protein ANO14919_019800 [Xylariales sp. No.14919]